MVLKNGQHKLLGWVGRFKYPDKEPHWMGTVYTHDFNPNEAREALCEAHLAVAPAGAELLEFRRGETKLIFHDKEKR